MPPAKPQFMRTGWSIAHNIRLESLLPPMQVLLCFSKFTKGRIVLILSLYRIYTLCFFGDHLQCNSLFLAYHFMKINLIDPPPPPPLPHTSRHGRVQL